MPSVLGVLNCCQARSLWLAFLQAAANYYIKQLSWKKGGLSKRRKVEGNFDQRLVSRIKMTASFMGFLKRNRNNTRPLVNKLLAGSHTAMAFVTPVEIYLYFGKYVALRFPKEYVGIGIVLLPCFRPKFSCKVHKSVHII